MKTITRITLGAAAAFFFTAQVGAQAIFENFQNTDEAPLLELQNIGAATLGLAVPTLTFADTSAVPEYTVFGTWLHSSQGGINDAGTNAGTGANNSNQISSIGMARPMDFRATNGRLISVVYGASNFLHGTTYTVSFDVIPDEGATPGTNSSRYWLAEVSGYNQTGNDYVRMNVAYPGLNNVANVPFTGVGAATVNYLHGGPVAGPPITNGVLIDQLATSVSFSFTYDSTFSPDIAFSAGAVNNFYAFDNFAITAVSAIPEPSSIIFLSGLGILGFLVVRRRRQ